MKQESLIRWKELLVIQINHWVFYTIALTCLGITGNASLGIFWWMLLGILPYVLFLIRRYTDNFAVFVLSHGGIGALLLLLPIKPLEVRITLIAAVVWYVVHSGILRLRNQDRLDTPFHPAAGVILIAAALLIQISQGQKGWDIYYITSAILFIGFLFLHRFLKNYLNFLIVNSSSAVHMPEKEMLCSGMALAAMYTALGAAVLFLVGNISWLSTLLDPLRRVIAWLLNRLLAGSSPETIVEQPNQINHFDGLPLFEGAKPFLFWVILEKIIFGAVVIALAAAIVFGIVKWILFLWEGFHKRAAIQDDALDGIRDIREKCGIDHKKGEKKYLSGFRNPTQRIRKLYRKKVLDEKEQLTEGAGREVLGNMTARECSRKLKKEKMGELYEKARYSQEECTMEDVREMKNAIRKR